MNTLTRKALRTPKRLLEGALGVRILKTLPRGLDFVFDMRNVVPWPAEPEVIIDVGANAGQSAIPLSKAFPDAMVQCLEPSMENFDRLVFNVKGNKRIFCHHLGLSESEGKATLALTNDSTMHHIRAAHEKIDCSEEIRVTTLDNFCRAHEIDYIDVLKIDTEGHDLAVLLGARGLLSNRRIGVVYFEASMNTANRFHAPYEAISKILQQYDYYLFGIYEQVGEWTLKMPYLRRANIAFLSPEIATRSI